MTPDAVNRLRQEDAAGFDVTGFTWFEIVRTAGELLQPLSIDNLHIPFPKTGFVARDDRTGTYATIRFEKGDWWFEHGDGNFVPRSGLTAAFCSVNSKQEKALVVGLHDNGSPVVQMDEVQCLNPITDERWSSYSNGACWVLQAYHQTASTPKTAHNIGYRSMDKARKAKGKRPFLAVTTVTVQPVTYEKVSNGGTHASPRLHDRRGHWRNYRSGKRVWISNCKVGHAKDGIGYHDYEVRS